MTLYWPMNPAQIDLAQARLHAFVIGVGNYPHLMGGDAHPSVANFGLGQLTTTTVTAVRIAEWLAMNFNNPSCPLGSIELLLSPSQSLTDNNVTSLQIDASNMNNIRMAFGNWHKRCNSHSGNMALFYFAGHGISTASQFLLASDFGDPAVIDLWENCLDFDGLRVGMKANTADTQVFFVDACREKPIDALIQNNPHGQSLCNSTIFDQVKSSAAYYATADGSKAYGKAGELTYFANALISSLEGVGAHNQGGTWVVDTFILANSLGQLMADESHRSKLPLSCNPDPDGQPAPIHYPIGGLVRVLVDCLPPQVDILLQRGGTSHNSPLGDPRPWTRNIEPGEWNIQMTDQIHTKRWKELLLPPLHNMRGTLP